MTTPKRDHLLETAEALFSKEGFKGVSVDRLLKEAGVAKMTLYKGFESKDALICETLRRRADRLALHIETFLKNSDPSPQEQLLCCFDAMQSWSKRKDFNGCYFINALGEYGTERENQAAIVRDYKAGFLARLEDVCRRCDVDDPAALAKSMLMLIDGATVTHMTLNDKNSYGRARDIAAHLLTAAS